MESNRESARRSRMRKQKHLDELMGQADELRKENNEMLTRLNVTTQHYVKVEADNSVLRAQMTELTQRLNSLNEMLRFVNSSSAAAPVFEDEGLFRDVSLVNVSPWTLVGGINQHPIMASAEMMFDY